jgi:hypothetical protein
MRHRSHLDDRIAALEIAAHLGTQRIVAFARIVIAARSIDKHTRIRRHAVAFGQQTEERLVGDFRDGVPHRHVERSNGDRALAMTAGLLIRHHCGPDAVRIEIVASRIEQRRRIGLEQSGRETLSDQPTMTVASIRIEAATDNAPSFALDVGDDGDQTGRHLREVDIRVANRGRDGPGDLADVDDSNRHDESFQIVSTAYFRLRCTSTMVTIPYTRERPALAQAYRDALAQGGIP